jgi:hypothetical protein
MHGQIAVLFKAELNGPLTTGWTPTINTAANAALAAAKRSFVAT